MSIILTEDQKKLYDYLRTYCRGAENAQKQLEVGQAVFGSTSKYIDRKVRKIQRQLIGLGIPAISHCKGNKGIFYAVKAEEIVISERTLASTAFEILSHKKDMTFLRKTIFGVTDKQFELWPDQKGMQI